MNGEVSFLYLIDLDHKKLTTYKSTGPFTGAWSRLTTIRFREIQTKSTIEQFIAKAQDKMQDINRDQNALQNLKKFFPDIF